MRYGNGIDECTEYESWSRLLLVMPKVLGDVMYSSNDSAWHVSAMNRNSRYLAEGAHSDTHGKRNRAEQRGTKQTEWAVTKKGKLVRAEAVRPHLLSPLRLNVARTEPSPFPSSTPSGTQA